MTGGLSDFVNYCELMGGIAEHDAHWSTSKGRVEHTGQMYGDARFLQGGEEGAYETLNCRIHGTKVLEMSQEVLKGINSITLTVISGNEEVGVVHFADDVKKEKGDLALYRDGRKVAHVECDDKHKNCTLVVVAGPDQRKY